MHGRELLVDTLTHLPPLHALAGLPVAQAEQRIPKAGHSIAEIVSHMAFWQAWFSRRCQGDDEPMVTSAASGWPVVAAGSWPAVHDGFAAGLEQVAALAAESDRPVTPAIQFPPLAHYTVGDALVHVAQHNSHHLGQVILLRQLMDIWPPPSGSWTW